MKTSSLLRLLPLGLLPLAAACGGDARAAGGPVVRDSAGVQIVENAAPAWQDGEGWTVAAEPTVDIGVADGAAEYQFGQVAGAVRLSDGRIVVADGQARELRFFDAKGLHLATAGGEGGGPGEFDALSWIGRGRGDSILAWDYESRRLSVFDAMGRFAHSVQPEGLQLHAAMAVGALADGSWLTTPGKDFVAEDRAAEGEYRDSTPYLRFGADGRRLGTLGPFGATEQFRSHASGGGTMTSYVVFGSRALLASGRDRLLVGESARYEVRELTPEGELVRLVRRTYEPVAVSDADVKRHFEEEDRKQDLSAVPPSIRSAVLKMRQEQRAKLPHRATLPAFAALRVDEEGNLWVEESRRPGEEPPLWSVFDREGRWLGTVSTPARLEVYQIGSDWILGKSKDELDVEHVLSYRLEKSAAGNP